MRYVVTVDDNDRDLAPDKPWTALLVDTDDEASGIGATPQEAVRDLLEGWMA